MTALKHLIEYILLQVLFTAFRILPLDVSSYIGGYMARAIGPFLKAHKIAQNNLALTFPKMPKEEKREILTGMWDNLGRVAGEMPHMTEDMIHERVEFVDSTNHFNTNKQELFFSGHLANWELLYPIPHRHNVKMLLLYRQANNPMVDALITKLRSSQTSLLISKGPRNAIKMLRALKDGFSAAMLVDQKMNDGVAVPFFGRPAMTATAIAELAMRYDLPLIPARIVRTKGAHFKAFMYPPLEYEKTGDEKKDALAIMTKINAMLELWIREYPEQWFWVHRRWPKDAK